MDAITVIRRDHRAFEDWYMEYQNARSNSRKEEIAHDILDGLSAHTKMKETYFYPILEKKGKTQEEIVKDAAEKDGNVKVLVSRLENATARDELDEKMEELIDVVKYQVRTEEEEILPDAKKVLTEKQLAALGEKMEPHSAVEKAKN